MNINCIDKINCEMYKHYHLNSVEIHRDRRFCITNDNGLYSCKALDSYINYVKLNKEEVSCSVITILNKQ